MLPAAAEPFDSPAHIFEVLWEGVRAIAIVDAGHFRLHDRYGRDVTDRYPELSGIASSVRGDGLALDGEIVALDAGGKPDFARLRPRLALDPREAARLAVQTPVTFQAFDLLYREGQPVMAWPLRRRQDMLRQIAAPGPGDAVPDSVGRDGVAFFEAAREHGLGGIVAKERESRYLPGQRSRSWLTIRVHQKDEFVIGGFTYGGPSIRPALRARTGPFSSLLLGLFDAEGTLHYAGQVAGGFDSIDPEEHRLLDELVADSCLFAPEPALRRLVFWCRPELAATVRFADWAPGATLRFPVFEALRPDVPPESCRLDRDDHCRDLRFRPSPATTPSPSSDARSCFWSSMFAQRSPACSMRAPAVRIVKSVG